MIYLASPYSHEDPEIRHLRFLQVCKVAAQLMTAGEIVFSPIAHTHPIAVLSSLPTDLSYWEKYDREILAACSELRVLKLKGWESSSDIAKKIAIATELGIPITYMEEFIKGVTASEQ